MVRRENGNPPRVTARDFVPSGADLDGLKVAAASCRGCDLHRRATQTVFGEGASAARVVLVGEQPGDREDLAGKPFVGPAGRLLDRALADAGIDRAAVYVTNVVKHFKWEARGRRRIHKKPAAEEIAACRPWLDSELEHVRPDVVVCLGATAAQALLGRTFKVTKQRGEVIARDGFSYVATVHPSSILRGPDERSRSEGLAGLVADLRVAGAVAGVCHSA